MKIEAVLVMIFCLFSSFLLNINLHEHDKYVNILEQKTEKYVLGESPARGRILDRNGKVLVDNVGVINIVYRKKPYVSYQDELDLANTLREYVTDYPVTDKMKKEYFLLTHNDGSELLTDEEKKLYDERKLTLEEINNLKWERITLEMISYSEEELKVIYLYNLMNSGYYYEDKYLFREIDEDKSLKIMELNNPLLSIKVTSKRKYPYNEVLKSILGNVGSIPKEEVDTYIDDGYSLEDTVGISGIEKVYDKVLQGTKAKYILQDDYSLKLISDSEVGNDLYLNIDIDLQLFLEDTLRSELALAHQKKQSIYFHDAYSIIGEPSTGNILAMAGILYNDDGSFKDITYTALSSSYAMGSVVKGASSSVGYMTGAITVGEKILDSCVKLYYQPAKCSYKRLGYVDDITALKTSSNYFQFITAIKTTNNKYHYNMELPVTIDNFNTYRNVFKSYGLGALTEIDLPNEQIGMIGEKISGDLLLNLAIGQYDTYTPVELFQYINTIANRGKRLKINIAKQEDVKVLNEVGLENAYYDRILEGFYQVFHGGTASSYASYNLDVLGKTGTSETFYDSNSDGVVDTKTINSTVAFFFPRANPRYSMIVVAPNITNSEDYTYPFTKNVSLKVTNHLQDSGYLN